MNVVDENLRIIVAGASGYIGRALLPCLRQRFPRARITALSRSRQDSADPLLDWKACDLFSQKSIEEAMPPNADLVFYLVHSMGPTAQLDQGSFADYDLILADNFARAAKKLNVKHLIYLGGIIPEDLQLSLHLQSRLEVEQTFREHGLPLTVFRAGIILGEHGSSFQILLKLVKRLPIMICPKWTQSLTSPVDLSTVLFVLAEAALQPQHIGKTYDLAGCRRLSYVDMMRETARRLGLKRYFMTVPFFTPTLSRWWVTAITGAPKALVYPLIESLQHSMVARPEHLFPGESPQRSYIELLDQAYLKTQPTQSLFTFRAQRKTVRSVQRLPLPHGYDAEWTKHEYARWLPHFMRPFARATLEGNLVVFSILTRKLDLLELELSPDRSHRDRQLMYIKRGILVGEANRGRLEFRVVLGRRYILAAIHDFVPALPWFIYRYTQALIHLWTMKCFAWHLTKLERERKFLDPRIDSSEVQL